MQYDNIGAYVRAMEQEDKTGQTTISKYVKFNLRENIEKIESYINSKFTSGDTDSKGREKPFFNIVKAAVNVWYRATDIDRKNINITSDRQKDAILVFFANALLANWMRKNSFGQYLNKWGYQLAKYCSAVTKTVEKNGELIMEIVPWTRLICDPVDFDNNPKIEKLWLTPGQLRKRAGYNQAMVESLISAVQSRETIDGQKSDNRSGYILVYEVHGEFERYCLTGKEKDKKEYVQQMHVISFQAKKDNAREYDEFTLYKGAEEKDPYSIDHLIEEDNRVMGIGAVENLFEAQWMVNHTAKQIKDQLDLASKVFFQTADENFVGINAIDQIENGDILKHQMNMPLTQVNSSSHDITSLQNYQSQWKALGSEINNISESMLGQNPPSGTAWRQTEALLNESHSLFELMIENKGLALEKKIKKYVIPFLKKKLGNSKEIVAFLTAENIQKIDSLFIPNQAKRMTNDQLKEKALNNQEIVSGEQEALQMQNEQQLKQGLEMMGNKRFLAPSEMEDIKWSDVLKDFEWNIDIDVTGENTRREALATLNTVLQLLMNPNSAQALQSPNGKMLFNKILMMTTGLSPVELDLSSQTPQTSPAPSQSNMQSIGGVAPIGVANGQTA